MNARFVSWGIPLALVMLATLLHGAFLFGGYTFFDSDGASYYTAVLAFYKDALQSGESILWNPLIYSGFPMYASQSGILDPLYAPLLRLFDGVMGYHVRLAFDYALVLVLSYYAARISGVSRSSSALVGMGYLSMMHWVHATTMVANSLFLLPALVISFHKFFSGGRYWLWTLIGGISIGWSFLSGNAQITVYAVTLFGIYVLLSWRFLQYPAHRLHTFVLFFIGILSIGAISALPQVLPSMRLAAYSLRSGGLAYGETVYKAIELGDAILFFMPDYLYFPYLSGGRRPLYIGAFLFFTALLALSRLKEKRILVLAIPFLFALAASFESPLFYLLQQLPVLGYFRNPQKWMFAGAFFAAFLGAVSFDRLKANAPERREKVILKILGVPVALYALLVGMLNVFSEAFWRHAADYLFSWLTALPLSYFRLTKDLSHYGDALHRGIFAWREFSSFSNAYFLLPFLMLIISYGVLLLYAAGKVSMSRFAILGTVIGVATFVSVTLGQFSNRIKVEPLLRSQGSLFAYFLSDEDARLYRTYPFMLDAGFVERVPPKYQLTHDEASAITELKFETNWPNTNLYSGHASIEGYDPLIPKDMVETFALLGNDDSAVDLMRGVSREEKIGRFMAGIEAVGMMGAKYIISGIPLAHPLLVPKGEYPVSRYSIPVYVYEHRKALPKVYFASSVVPAGDLSPKDLAGTKNFADRTYIDCENCAAGSLPSRSRQPEIVRYENGNIVIRTESDAPQWLVVSESNLPTWEVAINGVSATLHRANLLYMAVRVPEGNHEIAFTYQGLLNERKLLDALLE